MKFKRIYFILLLLVTQVAISQDGIPVYSDYFSNNLYLLHPSMAGADGSNQLRLTARRQWFDQDEAPNLTTLSFNTSLGDQSGIGVVLFTDRNGYHSQTGGYLGYAHHLLLSRSKSDLNQVSFGLRAGFIQSKLDETQFDLNDFDPIIAGIVQSTSYFNVDVGASYRFLNFAADLTVKNLIFQNRKIYSEKFESNNQRRYILGASYGVAINNSFYSYQPSVLFQFSERTGEQSVDINLKGFRDMEFGRLWAGISYRRSFDGAQYLDGETINSQKLQYITPIFGADYKNFMLAYTYSYQTGNVKFRSGGFHQLTLGYSILNGKPSFWEQDMRNNGRLRPAY
ncbi:PorP/SprF family type IX secretion system membrane protein [Ulvibacter antarcticus]|uniref:Type IX secretion system PorP/SprF family membrane protein n=1 Tax=Ulvibacter antarcticus TaxID=442714 RepID=A0A3L9Y7J6_9FLAO|nr:type IX secretion system membrane protein PorP/SprF [Ulvibacter antarcticus]RMA56686.1 type IX secretion system PorP/SprF family membrane protein [Ulvibacter antarcticus]